MLGLDFLIQRSLFSFCLLGQTCLFRSLQFEIALKSQLNGFSNVLFAVAAMDGNSGQKYNWIVLYGSLCLIYR